MFPVPGSGGRRWRGARAEEDAAGVGMGAAAYAGVGLWKSQGGRNMMSMGRVDGDEATIGLGPPSFR